MIFRSRRGVRGSTYAFANSLRLQARLTDLGIRYLHRKDLAPTQAVRDRQAAADKATKICQTQTHGIGMKILLRRTVLNASQRLIQTAY